MVAQCNERTEVLEVKLSRVCDVIRELEAVNNAPAPAGRGRKGQDAVRQTITRYYADRLRVAVGMPAGEVES